MRDGLRRFAAGRRDFIRLYKTHNELRFLPNEDFFEPLKSLVSKGLEPSKTATFDQKLGLYWHYMAPLEAQNHQKTSKSTRFHRKIGTFRVKSSPFGAIESL